MGSSTADEAAFKTVPNGDDLEYGTFRKDGVPTPYEEVWRDVTAEVAGDRNCWILQSDDGSTFLGKIGSVFLGMHQTMRENFAVRKEVFSESSGQWQTTFESGPAGPIPTAVTIAHLESRMQDGKPGDKVQLKDTDFFIRGLGQI